jgi:hypothetical protein
MCIVVGVVLAFAGRPVRAGGPLVYADNGTIVKWATTGGLTSVTLTLDQAEPRPGNPALGLLTKPEADALVANVLGVWNGVTQSTVNMAISPTPLSDNITELNYQSVLLPPFPKGFNPVVYDWDGAIIDSLYGIGMRNQILGFASPIYYVDSGTNHPQPGNIIEGQVVLNGRALDGIDAGASNPEVTPAEFESVIVHELGHMLGLDHSQINPLDPTNDDEPTMFPMFKGGTAMRSLAPDDIAWISYFYPSSQYSASFGSISGQILKLAGFNYPGFQGINIIARRIGGARIDAISCVSGYLFRAGYGTESLRGIYLLPGMPPGDYTVEVEAIYSGFHGGSSVGPLDPPATFPGISGPEFYNGANESLNDNPTDQTPVSVVVGNPTSNINIILNTMRPPAGASHWSLYR